jgi:hypothetical protein
MPHGDPFINDDVPVSHSPAVTEAVRDYIRTSCRIILEGLGRESVAALIVSGSAGLGEVTALDLDDGELMVLSDVDLAVVMKSDAHRDRAKGMRPTLKRQMSKSPSASRICPPPELGVYSVDDLEIQARKMGVLEIGLSGRVLWGEKGVLERFPSFAPEEIPRNEAIEILFNRALELLEALEARLSSDPRALLRLLYASAKAYLDAGTSLAAFYGRYVVGYQARLDRAKQVLMDHQENWPAAEQGGHFSEGLSFWTDFKLKPDLEKVYRRYGVVGGTAGLADGAWNAFMEARVSLLAVWLDLVRIEGADVGGGVSIACRSLLRRESMRVRLAGWKRVFLGGGGIPFTRAFRLAPAGSPLYLLRLCAICLVDQYGPRVMADSQTRVRAIEGNSVLDEPGFRFLSGYFPAGPRGASGEKAVDEWRRWIVDVWRRWTERFWS